MSASGIFAWPKHIVFKCPLHSEMRTDVAFSLPISVFIPRTNLGQPSDCFSLVSKKRPAPSLLPQSHNIATLQSSKSATPARATNPNTYATPHITHYYRRHLPCSSTSRAAAAIFGSNAVQIEEETCFNIALDKPLSSEALQKLHWLLAETFAPQNLQPVSSLPPTAVEIGPRLNFQTAWSANAVSICHACGLDAVSCLEQSRRYSILLPDGTIPCKNLIDAFVDIIHDRMTEQPYVEPLTTFDSGMVPQRSYPVDVLGEGAGALRLINEEQGLGFDEQDIAYYIQMFVNRERNPTNVELFDLAQSNSEHSRHWFFRGRLLIDGEEMSKHLLDIVRDTLRANPSNSVVAFADNSSTIRGASIATLMPIIPGQPSKLDVVEKDRDILFTAETHNFPSGVAPFPGAETGTGGRIRDTAATGIGSLVGAGTAGYAVGNLHIPGYELPWEDKSFKYPDSLASPVAILINASNGASDYGNKFGEPVINGFARSYGLRLPDGQRREYVKPIMFSGGMGQMDHAHARKGSAELNLLVIKVGGPAYRIGMGGGAASSMMQGANKSDLDFNAVQRGDAEMAQKVYRVLRACVEMGSENPIVSIHDQGAGGNCNVVKELIYPGGATIDIRKIWVGDTSLSALEIWGAEYQEQFGLLLRPEHEELFKQLCTRENVVCSVLGSIDGSGRIVVWDDHEQKAVVEMDLEDVLGGLPQKIFTDYRRQLPRVSLSIPDNEDLASILTRVLSLMSVGSKRFLTTKVDRSVTGLVAQQQCVGPLQLPLSDYAITAQSHYSLRGSATSIGERPILTSLSAKAMARMSVGEMMTNIAGAKITDRKDIKCEGNWMWPAKLPGDCASLYDGAVAMSDAMIELGIAIDGGKDSLSMAANCPMESDLAKKETVRAPGTLVISGYATMENVELKLTPDLKAPGCSVLLHVDIANGKRRLGGSAVAQVFGQLGDTPPDVDGTNLLSSSFDVVQSLIGRPELLSYHDVSDGGLLVTILEMCFAGNCGADISIGSTGLNKNFVHNMFAEELGMVLEVSLEEVKQIQDAFLNAGVPCKLVGITRADCSVTISEDDKSLFVGDIKYLRDTWEKTSFALERQQANVACVTQEQRGLRFRTGPWYYVPWNPRATPESILVATKKPRVAIIREEGSNGDREMSSAFHMAGFEVWDVSMRDISSETIDLSEFRGIAFVGGFSYADVLDSAKGWAGVVRFNSTVRRQFDSFYERKDTFSLGVCNGCQLMALLERIPFSPDEVKSTSQPRFIHNESGRYESRFSAVAINEGSPAIMLQGMGGARLGVWMAHGEGRAFFPDISVLERVEREHLAAVKYVDDNGEVTMSYPANPNGSTNGIAGLCSRDGRHLALMPHPERTVLKWQWGYLPKENANRWAVSPWLQMFQNAYSWVTSI